MREPNKTDTISFRTVPEFKHYLDTFAKEFKMPVSALIRESVENYCQQRVTAVTSAFLVRAMKLLCGERGMSFAEAFPLASLVGDDFEDLARYRAWANPEILNDEAFSSMFDIGLKKAKEKKPAEAVKA